MPTANQDRYRYYLIACCAAFIAFAAYFAFSLSIWADEASTLFTTQNGLAYALSRAAADEKQAPLYFWILSIWRYAGDSIGFARIFSVICAAASLAVLAKLLYGLVSPRVRLVACILFAFHPYLFWAATEIRVYSLVILISVGVLYLFDRSFGISSAKKEPADTRLIKVALTLVAIAALYTNYYLAFVLFGPFVGLLAVSRYRDAFRYAVLMTAATIVFIPQALFVKAQLAANTTGFADPTSLSSGIRVLWRHVTTFIYPAGIFPEEPLDHFGVLRLWTLRIGLALIALTAVVQRRRLSCRTAFFAANTAAIAAGLLAAYFLLGEDYVEIRHLSVIFVSVIMTAASFADDICASRTVSPLFEKLGIACLLMLYGAAFVYSDVAMYNGSSKRGDWTNVGRVIRSNESAGQPIVVFPAFEAMAMRFSYSGVNKIIPDSGYFTFEREAAVGTPQSKAHQIEFVISQIPHDADEIWLATNESCTKMETCLPLENFINSNYTVVSQYDLYRETVRLLRKKGR